jgi:hypothetical protein
MYWIALVIAILLLLLFISGMAGVIFFISKAVSDSIERKHWG